MQMPFNALATVRRRFVTPNAALQLARAAFCGALVAMMLSAFFDQHILMINRTGSLPNWAFWLNPGKVPAKGDYIVFAPPITPLIARHFGNTPPAFGKIVYGVAGDRIDRVGQMVRVNGKAIAHLKPQSYRGEPLVAGPTGIVPRGCYWVGTPHPDGFDSRYADIGFVCRRAVLGTGEPIL